MRARPHISHRWRIGVVVAVLLLCLTPAVARAASITFDDLSQEQGFNFHPDVQQAFGFLTEWTVAGTPMTPDLMVKDPTGATLHVVGVLSSYTWDSSVGGPMNMTFDVSTNNRNALVELLHTQVTDTSETFSVAIWEYDQETASWFEALQPVSPPLDGLIEKSGGRLVLNVAANSNPAIQIPVNWVVSTSAVPAPEAQQVRFAPSPTLSILKQWGLGVLPPPDSDLALTNVPGDITTPATSSSGAVVTYAPPTVVDEDTAIPAASCDHASGSTFPVGTTTVTCTASDSDDSNSPVSSSFTVTVTDVTVTDSDLALTNVPANITAAATSSSGAVVTYTPPTVVDEDTPLPAVSCDHASGSTFPAGTTTVTCTATDSDDSNSPVSASFTVTVTDADLALTNVPGNVTTPATSSSGAVVTFTPPIVVDEDSPLPAVSCDHASGSTFPVGSTTVTCTASDSDDANSPVSTSFTVTVTDSDLAVVSVPSDISTAATSSAGAVVTYTSPTVVDEDSPLPAVSCDQPSGSTFPVGTTTVTCTASDSDDANSPVSVSFTVTVTDSDLALTNVPGNLTTAATSSAGAAVTYTPPTVVDEDSPLPAVSCDHASGSTFPVGTTTVTCTVSDSDDANSPVSATFTVTVTDADLALTDPPGNITTAATSSAGAAVTFTPPTVVDEDSPLPAVSCDHASGSTFPVGTTTVTCTVSDSDDANSPVSAIFTVTVTDADLALANVPGNITTPATSSTGAIVTFTPPTVVDEDSPLLLVSCDHPSGSTFPVGTTTVTCTASDADDANSPVATSFTVTVTDSDLALTNTPANMTVNATSAAGAIVHYTPPTAHDEDSPLPTVTCHAPSGSTFAIGTTTVTCTVTDPDDANSPVSSTFTVTVVGVSGQMQQVAAAVAGAGPGNSMSAKIQQAQAYFAAGDVADAKSTLNAFINEVKAQSGKKLTQTQAAQLIAAAQQILAVIG